jgi:signal transduction histidine kinase
MKTLPISIALFICVWCCDSFGRDEAEPINVEIVEDFSRLPYRFSSAGCTNSWNFPINLDTSGIPGLFIVQNNWRDPGKLSSVIFKWEDRSRDNTIAQFNAPTIFIISHYPGDFNRDNIEELAITYLIGDTVWLEILKPFNAEQLRILVEVGEDLDGSGSWDGTVFAFNDFDINSDGFNEIFVCVSAGFDLFPRYLACVDWKNGAVVWKYDMPPYISSDHTHIIRDPKSGKDLLLFGAGALCNGVISENLDDCHSYLICMTLDGQVLWQKQVGGKYTHTHPELIDYNDDGTPDIVTEFYPGEDESQAKDIIVVDIEGITLDYITLDKHLRNMQKFDIDLDSKEELCLYFGDNSIECYDDQLVHEKSFSCRVPIRFRNSCDFINQGKPQFLCEAMGAGLALFDSDYEQLAFLGGSGSVEVFKSDAMLANVFVRDQKGGCSYNIIPAPWHSFFARNPLLAFLAGFIPLSLIVAVTSIILFKFRQKNKTIARQRDSLDDTLKELRKTQQKLIEAEKYKQAKDMAGGFAHEIRNALFPAKASIKKIENDLRKHDQTESGIPRLTMHANSAITKAIELTNLISQYTRLDSIHEPENVNIVSVINEVLETNELRLKENSVEVNLKGSNQVCIESNRRQFFSVMNNLLLNSMDAMKEKSERRIDISWSENESSVYLEFHDTGSGIPPDLQESIFNAFRSYKKEKGIGLGLAMAKRIVEMYGGSISLESQPETGTSFILKLKPLECP